MGADMTTNKEDDEDFKLTWPKVFAIGAIVVALWVATPLVMLALPDLPARGQAGDLFGSVNALFSGLAFAGVIIAILLQREELRLQKEGTQTITR
jgi:hypothetical protein